MSPLQFTLKRLYGFLEQIRTLKESEFPYAHSKEALAKIEELTIGRIDTLEGLTPSSSERIKTLLCSQALTHIVRYINLLGFIIRSVDVRNAFEVYWPLLRLARDVLEPHISPQEQTTKLILSSEWVYSPLTFTEIPDLDGFVMIGLPAHESTNPLLIPLAGHELGHSVWSSMKLPSAIKTLAKDAIRIVIESRWDEYRQHFAPSLETPDQFRFGDLTTVYTWQKSFDWVRTQAEETFCDFVGVKLFGSSYLYAFAYLLSPYYASPRSPRYPNLIPRVRNMIFAAEQFGVQNIDNYERLFNNLTEPSTTITDKFQLQVADEALNQLLRFLLDSVERYISVSKAILPTKSETDRICNILRHSVPATRVASVADIINAGWILYEEKESDLKQEAVLRELILKNIEVFEIEQILKTPEVAADSAVVVEQIFPLPEVVVDPLVVVDSEDAVG